MERSTSLGVLPDPTEKRRSLKDNLTAQPDGRVSATGR